MLGQNGYFCCVFNELGVCVLLEPSLLVQMPYFCIYSRILSLLFSNPSFMKMFRVFSEISILLDIWGFDSD